MADFRVIVVPENPEDPDIEVPETYVLGFRVYERMSGMDPTLDRPKHLLATYAPDDQSPPSAFTDDAVHHSPPVMNHKSAVTPPYYARVLISPASLPHEETADTLLGRDARLEITDEVAQDTRHIRGIVLRVLDRTGPFERSAAIELQIYPYLWAFALSEKSRVWQEIDSERVLRRLIDEYATEFGSRPVVTRQAPSGALETRETVIQWDESDFEFVSRLLERDGLYYFFSHNSEQTRIHLADSRSPYANGYLPHRELALQPTLGPGGELFDDHVSFLTTQVQSVPRRYRVADYNPLQAQTALDYGAPAEAETAMEIYDYPGEVAQLGNIPKVARRRYAAVSARRRVIYAASRCPFVSPGHGVTLPGEDPLDEPRSVRPLQAVHEMMRDPSGKPYYRNWFEAIDGDVPYAPTQRTPVPAVHGTHNATVTSSMGGETVDVDKDSRALVLFQWDHEQKPVRVRLGQPWAGGQHGMSVLPRAGDEVLVGFIQGNTERPIILTGLHNSSTPKKINPTQMETRGLQGALNPGPERQNRYATALHNATGNALYFNDTSDEELVKLDAYKDFVLEIGHKVSYNPPTTEGKVISVEVRDGGAGYDPSNSPLTVNFSGGSGAAATAAINSQGKISHIEVTAQGSGYEMGENTASVPDPSALSQILDASLTNQAKTADYSDGTAVAANGGSGSGAKFDVTTSNGGVDSIAINAPGSGYARDDELTLPGGTVGAILSKHIKSAGTGYTDATGVSLTGGSGSGAKLDIQTGGLWGALTNITLSAAGNGYAADEELTVSGGNGDAVIKIEEVSETAKIEVSEVGRPAVLWTNVGINTYSTDTSRGSGETLEEATLDTEGADTNFVQGKSDRGAGLIRSYGDLTIYVGKFRETTDEYDSAEHQKEKTDANGAEILQPERGDFNLFVMGGTSSAVRGSFAYVEHPADGAFVSADYAAKNPVFGRIKSSASVGDSVGMHSGAGADISAGASTGIGVAFGSSVGLGASWGVSAEAPISASIVPFSVEASPTDMDVGGILGDVKSVSGEDTINAFKIELSSDQVEATTSKGLRTKFGLATTTAAAGYGALIGTTTGILRAANLSKSDTKTFLEEDLPRVAASMHILGGVAYAAQLIVGGILLTKRKVHSNTTGLTSTRVIIDPRKILIQATKKSMEKRIGYTGITKRHINSQDKQAKKKSTSAKSKHSNAKEAHSP